MKLHLRTRGLDLTTPIVMGVLNVTPDSFSDGGCFDTPASALAHARTMVDEGAALIDVGGESTRPGALPVPLQQELDRVVPVIERIRRELACIVSVDTAKPEVMRAAVAAGAELINDVMALRAEGALEAARDSGAAVCLMHMQGEPRTMQREPHYADVVADVGAFFAARLRACADAGIDAGRCVLDPGIGFGKTLAHNLALLAHLEAFASLGRPLLVGVSRKSMFERLLGRAVEDRLAGSLAAAAVAVWQGAAIVRAHDVRETVDAVRTAVALREAREA